MCNSGHGLVMVVMDWQLKMIECYKLATKIIECYELIVKNIF